MDRKAIEKGRKAGATGYLQFVYANIFGTQ